jgi:DNA-directed RNA polymerase specialized sigma54-like protein
MLKQFLNLKLSQKLSPQQIQLMKLIQLPTQAFEQRLLEEMNENPALEAGKEEDEYEKMSLKAKIMTTMTILNLIELRQKISISMSI